MSLYEKYNSQINIDHMFNVTSDVLKNQCNIDISSIPQSKENFVQKMKDIFDTHNVDELTDLNKILLEYHVDYYMEQEKVTENNDDINKSFSELVEERSKNKIITLKGNKNEKAYIEGTQPLQQEQPIIQKPHQEPSNLSKPLQDIEYIQITAQSKERKNIVASRYNFIYENNDSINIHHVSRILLPIEDNYIFTSPIISLRIPELEHKLHLEKKHVLTNGIRKYGIYEPFEIHDIKKKEVSQITIDIRDFNDIEYKKNDTLRINMVDIVKDIIKLTCSTIYKGDFQENDYIYIINNGDIKHNSPFISTPLKISSIKENIIYCRLSTFSENISLNDIDMSILNLSNQTVVYFNK